jgi:hypothetical protein
VRVADESDLRLCAEKGAAAAGWFHRCGLFCYGTERWDTQRAYEAKSLPQAHRNLDIHSVIADIVADLKAF